MTRVERAMRDSIVLGVLNAVLDESNNHEVRVDDVIAGVAYSCSDFSITPNDVISVADRCMCLGYDGDKHTVYAQ